MKTPRITLEKAKALLKRLDPSMPDGFAVLDVAYSKDEAACYVRWFDETEKTIYDDGVAHAGPNGAKAAYSFTPSCSYSVIWFNEAEDGTSNPVAAVLSPADVESLSKGGKDLILLDRA